MIVRRSENPKATGYGRGGDLWGEVQKGYAVRACLLHMREDFSATAELGSWLRAATEDQLLRQLR